MVDYDRLVLYFDGASRSNPRGPAGCGWALYEMDSYGADSYLIAEGKRFLGFNVSNNQAEYQGLIDGLSYVSSNWLTCNGLYIRGDAQIVICQMEGKYNVNSHNIIPYYNEARSELVDVGYNNVTYRHISRDKNWKADQLANQAIQEAGYR